MKKRSNIYILLLLLPCLYTYAQDDFGSSFSLDLSKKLFPGFTIGLEEEFRLRDNLSEADRFSSTLELSYKPFHFLKLGGAYNLINYNHQKKGWEVRHRYYFYATGSYKINRFTISLRERFQSTYRVGVKETATRANPKLYLRSRLKISYNIRKSKFEPFGSVEFYNTLNNPVENKMNKIRATGGTEYKLNKRNSLEAHYRYTNFRDDDDITGRHMIGLGYNHKF